jgi:hypothetical protein
LNEMLSRETRTTLLLVESMLATGDNKARDRLLRELNIFDQDGTPRPLRTAPPTGRASKLARAVVSSIDRINTSVQASWKTVAIAIALLAFL